MAPFVGKVSVPCHNVSDRSPTAGDRHALVPYSSRRLHRHKSRIRRSKAQRGGAPRLRLTATPASGRVRPTRLPYSQNQLEGEGPRFLPRPGQEPHLPTRASAPHLYNGTGRSRQHRLLLAPSVHHRGTDGRETGWRRGSPHAGEWGRRLPRPAPQAPHRGPEGNGPEVKQRKGAGRRVYKWGWGEEQKLKIGGRRCLMKSEKY